MHFSHAHQHHLGAYHLASETHVDLAIENALAAKKQWVAIPWEARAFIFLKAAELLADPIGQLSMQPR